MAAIPLVKPDTGVGAMRLVVVPSPSWPEKLNPQQSAPPFTTAQV
jgi:hypothetical protein